MQRLNIKKNLIEYKVIKIGNVFDTDQDIINPKELDPHSNHIMVLNDKGSNHI